MLISVVPSLYPSTKYILQHYDVSQKLIFRRWLHKDVVTEFVWQSIHNWEIYGSLLFPWWMEMKKVIMAGDQSMNSSSKCYDIPWWISFIQNVNVSNYNACMKFIYSDWKHPSSSARHCLTNQIIARRTQYFIVLLGSYLTALVWIRGSPIPFPITKLLSSVQIKLSANCWSYYMWCCTLDVSCLWHDVSWWDQTIAQNSYFNKKNTDPTI